MGWVLCAVLVAAIIYYLVTTGARMHVAQLAIDALVLDSIPLSGEPPAPVGWIVHRVGFCIRLHAPEVEQAVERSLRRLIDAGRAYVVLDDYDCPLYRRAPEGSS